MTQKSLLRLEREQRGWSQALLAKLLGTSELSVKRWEQGKVLPSLYFREKLCSLFEKDARALGLVIKTIDPPLLEDFSLYDPLLPSQILPTDSLIGRDAILHSLTKQLCTEPHASTLTLHGLPGVGKTTLLLALTQNPEIQQYFSDGVLWAGLGPQPHLVKHLSRWGNLLRVPQKEIHSSPDLPSLAKTLRSYIGSRRLLLVIDDIWQVEDALALQVGGANCTHLVTTRFPTIATQLSIHHALRISELEVTDGKALLEIFLPHLAEREPEMIEQLVREVGMLPLALTLIGRHLHPYDYLKQNRRLHAMLKQLRDRSARLHLSQPQSLIEHHPSIPPEQPLSLETVIAVSIQHLPPDVRKTLSYLALVPAKPNSFPEDLATALTPNAEEALNELMDAGLVENYGDNRYTLHKTIADYASNTLSLEDTGQEQAKKNLVSYALSWLEKHSEDYKGIEPEYTNLLAALELAIQLNLSKEPVALAFSLMPFWLSRGWYSEANRLLQQVFPLTQIQKDQRMRIRILQYLGDIARRQARDEQARMYYQDGMRLAQQEQVLEEYILFLGGLGGIENHQGNYEQAEQYARSGIELAQKAQDDKQLGDLLNSLAISLYFQNRSTEAETYYKKALALAIQTRQQELTVRIYHNLGAVTWLAGRDKEAETYFLEGLTLAQRIDHEEFIPDLLNGLGVISCERGDYEQATIYHQQALTQARKIGAPSLICNVLHNLAESVQRLKKWEQAQKYYQESLEIARETGERAFVSPNLVGLGECELMNENSTVAEVFFQEALASVLKDDVETISKALYGLSQIEAIHDNLNKALEYGRESLKMHEQVVSHRTNDISQWVKQLEASTNAPS